MRKTKVSFGPLLLLESRQCIPDQKRSIKTLRHSLSSLLLLLLLLPLCAMHIVYNRLICRMNIQTHYFSSLCAVCTTVFIICWKNLYCVDVNLYCRGSENRKCKSMQEGGGKGYFSSSRGGDSTWPLSSIAVPVLLSPPPPPPLIWTTHVVHSSNDCVVDIASVARPSPSRQSPVAPLFQSVTVLRLELLLTELIHCCCCCYAAIVPNTLRGGYYTTLHDVDDDDDDDECSSFLLSMQYVINKWSPKISNNNNNKKGKR